MQRILEPMVAKWLQRAYSLSQRNFSEKMKKDAVADKAAYCQSQMATQLRAELRERKHTKTFPNETKKWICDIFCWKDQSDWVLRSDEEGKVEATMDFVEFGWSEETSPCAAQPGCRGPSWAFYTTVHRRFYLNIACRVTWVSLRGSAFSPRPYFALRVILCHNAGVFHQNTRTCNMQHWITRDFTLTSM